MLTAAAVWMWCHIGSSDFYCHHVGGATKVECEIKVQAALDEAEAVDWKDRSLIWPVDQMECRQRAVPMS